MTSINLRGTLENDQHKSSGKSSKNIRYGQLYKSSENIGHDPLNLRKTTEIWNQIVGTKGVDCAGLSLLHFEIGANQISPAVVFGTAQCGLFFPREMLLWRFSMLLFVYKHNNKAKLRTDSVRAEQRDSGKVTGQNSLASKKTYVCSSAYFVEMSSNISSVLLTNEAFTSSKSAGLAGLRNKEKNY